VRRYGRRRERERKEKTEEPREFLVYIESNPISFGFQL
jgi:hypothetical protein